jgi:hypothetical protein
MKPGGSVTCLQNFTIEPFLKYHRLVSMKSTENEVGSSLFNSFKLSGNYMYRILTPQCIQWFYTILKVNIDCFLKQH